MNIEGAELFAVQDLLASGRATRIAGYYGLWDDLSRISPARDREFRRLLRSSRIRHLTFNDRDLDRRVRRWAIRTDIETSIRQATARGAAQGTGT
jgi:hypothetical protein